MQTLFRREIICARSAQIQVQWYPPVAPNVRRSRILPAEIHRAAGSLPAGGLNGQTSGQRSFRPPAAAAPLRPNYSGFLARLG
jgi:hypothetical protein